MVYNLGFFLCKSRQNTSKKKSNNDDSFHFT